LVKNCNASNRVATLEFSGGHLLLDDTNTAGSIGVSGLPKSAFTNNSNGVTINSLGLFPSEETITTAVWVSPEAKKIIASVENKAIITNETNGTQTVRVYAENGTDVLYSFTVSDDRTMIS